MVEGRPTIGVQGVQICVAICDDRIQGDLLLWLARQDSLVDRRLTSDALAIVDEFATIHQVLQVLVITLVRRVIQVLKHAAGELVSTNLKWTLSVIRMDWVSAHVHHVSAGLEVSIVARNVQGCELVGVLEI